MPRRPSSNPPKYRTYKPTGQAVVRIQGKDFYLGPHGSVASKREYDRLIAEWHANGRNLVVPNASAEITVVELIAMHVRFAKTYYNESSEWTNSKLAMRPLKSMYGKLRVAEFSPLKLRPCFKKAIHDFASRFDMRSIMAM
jgi:hypothetical protein